MGKMKDDKESRYNGMSLLFYGKTKEVLLL